LLTLPRFLYEVVITPGCAARFFFAEPFIVERTFFPFTARIFHSRVGSVVLVAPGQGVCSKFWGGEVLRELVVCGLLFTHSCRA